MSEWSGYYPVKDSYALFQIINDSLNNKYPNYTRPVDKKYYDFIPIYISLLPDTYSGIVLDIDLIMFIEEPDIPELINLGFAYKNGFLIKTDRLKKDIGNSEIFVENDRIDLFKANVSEYDKIRRNFSLCRLTHTCALNLDKNKIHYEGNLLKLHSFPREYYHSFIDYFDRLSNLQKEAICEDWPDFKEYYELYN
jgi:hypothetical protein